MDEMAPKLSIRIASGIGKIGAKQIAFLEAIQSQGSISGAGRFMGLSYRGARLLLEAIDRVLCEPAISAKHGGHRGGSAALTPAGVKLVRLYRRIEVRAQAVAVPERREISELVQPKGCRDKRDRRVRRTR